MSTPFQYRARGLQLCGQRFGDPSGPKVLALHGWLDNSNSFARLAPLIPERCWVALDLPGHGQSEHRCASAQYHMVDWVGDVLDAADALGWRRFTLVGHSMGAAVAALVASCYPARVDRLVLLDGLGPLSRDPADGPAHLVQHRQQVDRLRDRKPTLYGSLDEMAATLARVVPGLPLDAAMLLVARGARKTPDGYESRCDRRLRATSLFALTEPQVTAFLSRIACPSLLVRPHGGYPFPEAQMRARCALFKGLQVAEISGCHHAHLVDPHTVAARLNPFLRGATAAA